MPRHPSSKRSVSARTESAAQRGQKEARLQQAAAELGNGDHNSIRKAAAAHDIPEATLRHRMEGHRPKAEAQIDQQRLTPAAEKALVEHIRRCAVSGYPLTPALLRQYANSITRPVPGSSRPPEVTHAWLQSFLLRHPAIRTHWSRCLDNERLTGANKGVIRQWFDSLGQIMCEYSMASTNIFNMDETGFMFGIAGSERIVVPSGNPASRFRAQPGNRESATVIECIGSGGQVLPPLVITKGVRHTVGEHRRMTGIPTTWHFSKSPNGWTNAEIAVEWLETIFDPSTKPSTPSEWRLLIIDGHGSHTSTAFCEAAWARRIIPFLLPAHATHVMQPLDISIFGPLTGMYRRLVAEAAEHVGTIDKAQFGTFYAQAREKVLTQSRARKAFSDSGIMVDPSPEIVLRRLAGASIPIEASGTQQRQPLQKVAVPRTASAFNATVDAYRQEPELRDARTLKHSIMQAHEEAQASNAVLEAENSILRKQQEHRGKTSEKLGRKRARGDTRVLTKDRVITREHAEQQLVAKVQPTSRNGGGNHQEEEVVEVSSPKTAVPVGNDESYDGDEAVLASTTTPPAPLTQTPLDNLDDNEPLSAISDGDDDPFGFFEALPQPGPSCMKH